jgi:hypothetical protein
MIISRNVAAAVALVCSSVIAFDPAAAFDLDGAWASDPSNCAKIFVGTSARMAFSDNSDIYGGGFIVRGDQLIGKAGRCRVKARKVDGARIHLIAECASDIMYQNMQFSLAVVDDNTVNRIFPGIDGMDMSYARCPAP